MKKLVVIVILLGTMMCLSYNGWQHLLQQSKFAAQQTHFIDQQQHALDSQIKAVDALSGAVETLADANAKMADANVEASRINTANARDQRNLMLVGTLCMGVAILIFLVIIVKTLAH